MQTKKGRDFFVLREKKGLRTGMCLLSFAFLVSVLMAFSSFTAQATEVKEKTLIQNDLPMEHILITRKGSVKKAKGPEATFTGDVAVEFSIPRKEGSPLSVGLVTFQPRARTNWHTHPYGQYLLVTEGKGFVQEWGKEIQEVTQGDIVWFPKGVKHWHGAAPDSVFSHYALQEVLSGSSVEWMEPVTDAQYNNR